MSRPGSLVWFARHEGLLAWRDLVSLMTAGRRRRLRTVAFGAVTVAAFLHLLAWLVLHAHAGQHDPSDRRTLLSLSVTLLLAWSLMLSQAMESVTRAFYARGDLDLILSAPVAAWRLFAVRSCAMAVTIVLMALSLAAAFIDVMAWLDGARWLAAYGVALALAMLSVAFAIGATVALFALIGPRRTRLVAQVVAAVIGAAFVIGLQFAAILSTGSLSRLGFLQSDAALALAPAIDSALWWPARAAMGDAPRLLGLIAVAVVVLGCAIALFAPRFGDLALSTAGAARAGAAGRARALTFHAASPAQALRRKEWKLLLRDPWLASQTLMQLLYLLPPAFLLWRSFSGGGAALAVLVPVLVMAAGQLAGALAWLAISGEDAPDLVASAPVTSGRVLRGKVEAVMSGIALVFAPFVIALALTGPSAAVVAAIGLLVAAAAATWVQFRFRVQARRSQFRRRQTSSRIATFAEALSSIGWAATSALAVLGLWLAVVPGVLTLMMLGVVWAFSPGRA
jgi:ABC-2 type transport system permease protein